MIPPTHAPSCLLEPHAATLTTGIVRGVARDPAAGLFKTWYGCKCAAFGLCYATSRDGRTFDRPKLRPTGVPNCVLFPPAPGVERSDGGEVVLDLEEPDPSRRYKMAEKPYCSAAGPSAFCRDPDQQAAGGLGAAAGAMNLGWRLLASADGVSGWRVLVNKTGLTGDAGTVFKNPFRNRWVFSIKAVADQGDPTPENGHLGTLDRWRMYHDSADLFGPAADDRWGPAEPVPWLCADALDQPWLGSTKLHTAGPYPGLYVFGAAACESPRPLATALLVDERCCRCRARRRVAARGVLRHLPLQGHRPHPRRPALPAHHRRRQRLRPRRVCFRKW